MNVPTRKRILLMLISVMVLLAACGSTGPQDMRDSASAFAEKHVRYPGCCLPGPSENMKSRIKSAKEIMLTEDDLAQGITEKWCYLVEVSAQFKLENGGLSKKVTHEVDGVIAVRKAHGVESDQRWNRTTCSDLPWKKYSE